MGCWPGTVFLRKQEPRAMEYAATLGSCFRRSTV